jgi:hypothetical protein
MCFWKKPRDGRVGATAMDEVFINGNSQARSVLITVVSMEKEHQVSERASKQKTP